MMMNKGACVKTESAASLAVKRDSQTISKTKPKVRIIHLFAPEIIKTDIANFRELVQRLTGKPTEDICNKKVNSRRLPSSNLGPHPSELRERINREEQRGAAATSGGVFLGGFGQLEGFMEGYNREVVMFPVGASRMENPTLFV